MGFWAWMILLVIAAALATAMQYLFFRQDTRSSDYDWVFFASGALIGGFTATIWYPVGPVIDGLHMLPALAGEVILGTLVELIYRRFIRPRQNA